MSAVRPLSLSALLPPRACALVFVAGLAAALAHYPLDGTWLAPVLAAFAALLLWRPWLWLLLLPALLPFLDLAPWTGQFYLQEFDLLLLATAAIGYWHLPRRAVHARVPAPLSVFALLASVAYAAAAWRGITPLQALGPDSFASYLSPYNGLRMAKAWAWILVLLPLLVRDAGPGLERVGRLLVPGMLAGLALVALACIWERAMFPGLSDFATEYRTTAPFSSMHTGGAALDAYLALCTPLLGCWLAGHASRRRSALALLLLAFVAYAAFTTFSRAVYLAYAVSAAVLAVFGLWRALQARSVPPWPVLGTAALAAFLAWALFLAFRASGYRGLLAVLPVLGAALALATQRVPARLLPATLLCGAVAEAVALLAFSFGYAPAAALLKPPYLLFALCAGVFVVALWQRGRDHPALLAAAFFGMVLNAAFIAWHWAGGAGLQAVLPALLAAMLTGLVGAARTAPRRQMRRASVMAGVAPAMLLVLAIPVASSYFAGTRLATVAADLDTRMRHWRQVASMMDTGGAALAFGMGLGSYPSVYYWNNPTRELPGRINFVEEPDKLFLRLTGPAYRLGYGELMRLLQRVPVRARASYLLSMDVRRTDAQALLGARLCERQLLYPLNCVGIALEAVPADAAWHRAMARFDSGTLDGASWPLAAPTQLELAVAGPQLSVDIDNVSLVELDSARELVANGGFGAGNRRWFFSSDRHHLPWHVKNLALYLYFEAGLLGLGAVGGLLACGFLLLALRSLRGDVLAALGAAGLAGFLTVGLFDSLLDVPRIAVVVFLLLFALTLRAAPSAADSAPAR